MLSFPLFWQVLSLFLCVQVQADYPYQTYADQVSPPYSGAQLMSLGQITDVTLNDPNNILSGGTITVDGTLYVVPKNSMLTTPQQVVLWSELWVDGVVQMPLWPEHSWEASIFANEVNGTLIAGMVFIEQASARLMTGFINQIDSATGVFYINGISGQSGSGIKARINDPIGRFGLPYTDNPLWAADTENPSITAITGMPLCIQRPFVGNATDDPLCPTKNRPLRAGGNAHTMLTFLPESQRTASDPDPNFFVPLAVGDYVTLAGTEVEDNVFAVWNLIANIGIFTPPGEQPVYMQVQRGQYAITGPATAENGETRAVVFTTDVTTPITWYAIDLDPCTGATTWRPILTEQPLANLVGQEPGKTVFRGGAADFSPAPRYIGFKTESGMKITNNSIVAGVYISPVNGFANGFIFAELTVFGDRMFALEFEDIDFIAKGSGPYIEGNPLKKAMVDPPIIGQLDPWPGVTPPTPVVCAVATTTTVPSGSPTPTSTSVSNVHDQVTILDATFVRRGGESAFTVNALDSIVTSPGPVLTLNATADVQNPVGNIQMINLGDGMYTVTFSTHNNLNTIFVYSSDGGSASFVL